MQGTGRVCCIAPKTQKLIASLTDNLVTKPYNAWGKNDQSWDDYTIVFPHSFGSARRKKIKSAFQLYTEAVFFPVIVNILFGENMKDVIKTHLMSFKVSTIIVGMDADYYGAGKDIYHMHLDNKVGTIQPKNKSQKRKYRMVFSIPLPETPEDSEWTVYLKNQRKKPFDSQRDFHGYMKSRYVDWGTTNGKSRPLYSIPDSDVFRAKGGEVFVHPSHVSNASGFCQPIHSEPNPCPPRILFTIDFQDVVVKTGKKYSVTRVPIEAIKKAVSVIAID